MSNSTETYWDIDGISLQTYAWNIETLGGDRMAPPPVRGDDLIVPYLPGTVWAPKIPDARVISLGMWVLGSDEQGNIPNDENSRRTFDRNWRKLRNLLFRPRKQFTLTKRFWVETEDLIAAGVDTTGLLTDGDWTLYVASAKASYAGGLSPNMTGPNRAAFTVDIRLSDPFFYSEPITVPFSMQTGGANPGPQHTIEILGDGRTSDILVDFVGPLTSPQITAVDADGDPWVRYATVIADGETAHIDIKMYSANQTSESVTFKSSGYVLHFGDRAWLFLDPGPVDLSLSAQEGTGTAVLTYRPAWL